MKLENEKVQPFECYLCDSKFEKRSKIIIHVKTVHDKEKPFECRHMNMNCSKKLKTQTSRMKSDETIHIAPPEVQDIKSQPKEDVFLEHLGLYGCDICEKAMSSALTLEAHYKEIHKSNLAFGCNTCSERYPKADLLNQHELCCSSKLYDNIK